MGKREKWFPTSNFDFNFDFRISSFQFRNRILDGSQNHFPLSPFTQPGSSQSLMECKRGKKEEKGGNRDMESSNDEV